MTRRQRPGRPLEITRQIKSWGRNRSFIGLTSWQAEGDEGNHMTRTRCATPKGLTVPRWLYVHRYMYINSWKRVAMYTRRVFSVHVKTHDAREIFRLKHKAYLRLATWVLPQHRPCCLVVFYKPTCNLIPENFLNKHIRRFVKEEYFALAASGLTHSGWKVSLIPAD
jgi:hypothetical protein